MEALAERDPLENLLIRDPGAMRLPSPLFLAVAAGPLAAAVPLTVAALAVAASQGHAQSATLDEGRFLLSVDGRPAGSESFTIRGSGSGEDARILAQAQIELDGSEGAMRLAPALEAEGEPMDVSGYQIKISGARQEEIYVTLADRRFITKIRSEQGEREREYRAASGTILLDRGVAHQFYFLARRLQNQDRTTFPVIRPREGRQYQLTVESRGRETLSLGGTEVEARRLHLEGGGEAHDLWIDDQARVLRVESPESGYLAVRQQPPGSG